MDHPRGFERHRRHTEGVQRQHQAGAYPTRHVHQSVSGNTSDHLSPSRQILTVILLCKVRLRHDSNHAAVMVQAQKRAFAFGQTFVHRSLSRNSGLNLTWLGTYTVKDARSPIPSRKDYIFLTKPSGFAPGVRQFRLETFDVRSVSGSTTEESILFSSRKFLGAFFTAASYPTDIKSRRRK